MASEGLDRRSVGRALAAASVVLSLVFVGYEIRQNTLVARAAAAQAFSQQIIDFNQILVTEPFPTLNVRLAAGELRSDFDARDLFIIDVNLISMVRIWESLYRSVQSGLIDEGALGAVFDGPGPFSQAYFIESWPTYRSAFAPDFVAFFEGGLDL